RDLLNAGVIVHTYNPHIGSFLPSLGSSTNQSLLGGRGADIVMKSSGGANAIAGYWPTCQE
ncbi:MAG: hypothetical protein P4L92_11585, partial [Rudaea sp.]|nr:hypothetical protein [Rudaea sp.]